MDNQHISDTSLTGTKHSRHAVYYGNVRHRRFTPKEHRFNYQLMQWWLDLSDLENANGLSRLFSVGPSWAPLQFRAENYLPNEHREYPEQPLNEAVLAKMSELAAQPLSGNVFFLGNIRNFGIFFSPINCYYLQNSNGEFTHMLAEVSNTPWNERHYYLLDVENPQDHDKAFHVSPFNPLEMRYHWRLSAPQLLTHSKLLVHIEAHREQRVFDASMTLTRYALNQSEIKRVLRKHPWMALKIVSGIYWQALKLFAKRVPYFGHPGNKKDSGR
ncbi:DUF1365 domain-containing protein [Aliidiomarina shirensis]|uniref:DUF1365 domain-containing protein n=1 Tax=Aliidiomarina shirensis TaxID=1048642 RepID=A0A432WXC5_9GAMM|nr:DUF1365 domain-containing protein [Aliidiomarina shirensis]RUO38434.1 DUF1365 domain-containing protein [Aliidiomarina shirensis]